MADQRGQWRLRFRRGPQKGFEPSSRALEEKAAMEELTHLPVSSFRVR